VKQYVFYDKASGDVRHVHQVLSAEKGRSVEVDEDQLSELVERMVDAKATPWLYTDVAAASSRAAVRHVDTEKRKLRTTRLTARDQDRLRRRER
jgi:hypothetical protein